MIGRSVFITEAGKVDGCAPENQTAPESHREKTLAARGAELFALCRPTKRLIL